MAHKQPPPHQQLIGLLDTIQCWIQNRPMYQSWTKLEEPIKRFPSNSYNVFEVVDFGAFCGIIHSIFHVKKHLAYMSLME